MEINKQIEEAIWIAKNLFSRNRVSGSSANLSFCFEDNIYITGSGTSFGQLTPENFAVVTRDGNHLSGPKPSKEMPMHLLMYKEHEDIRAVLHTHSFYSTIWSMVESLDEMDAIPKFTPYLEMKLGRVILVPYAPPGSQELFQLFGEKAHEARAFLLKNHGPVVGHKNLMETFYGLEELEESAKIAWTALNSSVKLNKIDENTMIMGNNR